jgi:hypothetical protein
VRDDNEENERERERERERETHTHTHTHSKRFPEDSEVTMIVETDRLLHAFLPQTSGLKMAGQMRKETDRQTEEEVKRKLRVRERRHTLTMTTTTTTTSKDDCCQTKKENSSHASLC